MPNLGAHVSTAGGLHTAFERATTATCQVVQIFSKNQRQWHAKPLSDQHIQQFRTAHESWGSGPVIVHDSYLINMASPDDSLWQKSIAAFADELQRCEQLGIPMLVTHPGAHVGSGEAAGLARIGAALNQLLEQEIGGTTQILLETTAGQGSTLGYQFEHLAQLIALTEKHPRIGICVDTCHIFAAGYDIRTAATYTQTIDSLLHHIDQERIRAFHLNDSQGELGSRRDRHAAIGAGAIGIEGFRQLMNDPRFTHVPMVLETPKEPDESADTINLATLRNLRHTPAQGAAL